MNYDEPVRRVQPRTREERRALANVDEVQKVRLAQRREGFASYENPGNIAKPSTRDPGYIDEADRFNTDVQELIHEDQYAKKVKNEAVLSRKRAVEADRLEAVKQRNEESMRADEERLDFLVSADYGRKNRSGAAYDPITLDYGDGKDGERLKFEDDSAVWRAQMRARSLDQRGNSQFNPITGKERRVPDVAPKPFKPEWM
ncbi:flagellar associated protein [Carpediemonas membranifera]|uniref:Flagellar associated protein n=1 Tax=Carpediemonas membranifera TaxID=201153 RepID=A0A8J6E128_9EUKA|nr:flagellar associated protein [Carpediemonas membranifera]|eukprot:KAG9390097.1 flagellar associated protein [Carpediemonas membranifera]